MVASNNPAVVSIFNAANAPLQRQLVNVHNIEVVSIVDRPGESLNAVAEIIVDRAIDANGDDVELAETETRYFNRSIEFHRFDIAEAIDALDIVEDGALELPGFDAQETDPDDLTQSFIDAFNDLTESAIHFTLDDITVVKADNDGLFAIVAKQGSLGYRGRKTLSISADAQ